MEYSKEDAETLENIRTRVCQLEYVVSEMKRDKADMGAIKLLEMSINALSEKLCDFIIGLEKKETKSFNWGTLAIGIGQLVIAGGMLFLALK